jgi:hypothetical protein
MRSGEEGSRRGNESQLYSRIAVLSYKVPSQAVSACAELERLGALRLFAVAHSIALLEACCGPAGLGHGWAWRVASVAHNRRNSQQLLRQKHSSKHKVTKRASTLRTVEAFKHSVLYTNYLLQSVHQ